MMTRNTGERREGLATEIRRQFGNKATTRFLRTLPAFQTDSDMPDEFKELLSRLNDAESSPAGGGRQ